MSVNLGLTGVNVRINLTLGWRERGWDRGEGEERNLTQYLY